MFPLVFLILPMGFLSYTIHLQNKYVNLFTDRVKSSNIAVLTLISLILGLLLGSTFEELGKKKGENKKYVKCGHKNKYKTFP